MKYILYFQSSDRVVRFSGTDAIKEIETRLNFLEDICIKVVEESNFTTKIYKPIFSVTLELK